MFNSSFSKLRSCLNSKVLVSIFCSVVLFSSTFLEVRAQSTSCTTLGSPGPGSNENTLGSGYFSQACDMDVSGWAIRIEPWVALDNTPSVILPTISILAPSNTIYNSGIILSYNSSTIRNMNTGASIQNSGSIQNYWDQTTGIYLDQAGIYNLSGSQLNIRNLGDISGSSFGIYSDGSSLIENYQVILGTSGSTSVGIDATQASIYNFSSGVIGSDGTGIRLRDNSLVNNGGGKIGEPYSGTSYGNAQYSSILYSTSRSQVGIEIQGSGNTIYNRLNPTMPFNPGIISGAQRGIWIHGGGNNNIVINEGYIYGDNHAIEIDSSVAIHNYGAIEASSGNAIIVNGPGQNVINNYATTDSYANTGKIVANAVSAISLGNGTNVINNFGIIGSNSIAIELISGVNTVNNYDLITSPNVGISLGGAGVINNYGRIGDLSGTYQSGTPTSQAIWINGSNNIVNNLNVPNFGIGTIEASSSAISIADSFTNNQINNDGFISGTERAIRMGTASPGGYHTIQNTGIISSNGIDPFNIVIPGAGIAIDLAGAFNNINNSGVIYGTDTGIVIYDDNNTVVNQVSGVIQGGTTSINIAGTYNNVNNAGVINSTNSGIVIYGDDNTIVNQISGVIQGGFAGITITPSSLFMGTTQITNYGIIRGVDSILTNTGLPVGNLIVSNAGTLDGNLDLSTSTNARLEIFGQQAQIVSNNSIFGGSNAIFSVGSLALGAAQFTLRSDVSGFDQMQILLGSTLNIAANQVTSFPQTVVSVGHFYNDGRLIVPAGNQLSIFGNYSQSGVLELGVASTSSFGQLTIQGNADFGNSTFRIASGSTIMPYTTYASVLNVMGAITGSLNVVDTYAQNNYAYTYSLIPQTGNPNSFDLSLGGGTLILTTYEISQGATLVANASTNLNYTYINNYGTLAIPATVNMPVTGLYTQTGALSLGIQSLNQYGRLNIQGAANLSGGSLQIADGSNVNPGQYSGIITAVGGITGTLGSSTIKAPHRSYSYSTDLSADAQSLNLTIGQANYSKPLLQSNATQGLLNMASYSDRLIQKRFTNTASNKSESAAQSSFWMTPFGEKSKLSSDATLSSGYRMDRSGLAVGADTNLSKQWLLGLAMSTGQGRFTGMDAKTNDRANIKNHELIAYSEYALNPMVDARVLHAQGWANTTGSRYDNNMETIASNDYRSRYHHSSFELALNHQLSGEFRVIPSLGLAYTQVKSDSYLDTSRLSIREEKSDAFVGVIKANFEYIQDANKLGIQVGLKHNWKAQRSQPQLMTADGHMFLGQGIETKANRALLGLTYQRQLKKDLEFDLAYDLDRSSNYIAHAANAKLKMLF